MQGRVYTIVPAAGSAIRMGLGYSKAYVDLAGVPLLGRTLRALLKSPFIDRITTAVRPGEEDLCRREVVDKLGLSDRVTVVAGGEERMRTVWELLVQAPDDRDLVLIHDGARPFVSEQLVHDVLTAAVNWDASLAALPATDTIKLSDDGGETVTGTLDRRKVHLAQTPQAFKKELIIAAHRRAVKEKTLFTDDASLVEAIGRSVRLVPGDPRNIKVTSLEDLELARWILEANRP